MWVELVICNDYILTVSTCDMSVAYLACSSSIAVSDSLTCLINLPSCDLVEFIILVSAADASRTEVRVVCESALTLAAYNFM